MTAQPESCQHYSIRYREGNMKEQRSEGQHAALQPDAA